MGTWLQKTSRDLFCSTPVLALALASCVMGCEGNVNTADAGQHDQDHNPSHGDGDRAGDGDHAGDGDASHPAMDGSVMDAHVQPHGDGDGGDGDVAGDGDHANTDAGHPTGDGDGNGDGDGDGDHQPPPIDVTFFVVADSHADPDPNNATNQGLKNTARVINRVSQTASWPGVINGKATGFIGGSIAEPKAVVFAGDLTGWGNAGAEIPVVRNYFQQGASGDAIKYPAYLGLGNHDLAQQVQGESPDVRDQYWAWMDERHKGASAPVLVTNFDAGSHAYSFDIGGVHFVQTHRFAGDVGDSGSWSIPSSLSFLEDDLNRYASDGRPVFVFHHYGMDAFGTNGQWWNADQRTAYRGVLGGYNISGIIVGHSHAAFNYEWEGARVFQVNNVKAEINTGNNDGNGSFAIVRVTDTRLDYVTCRWLDDQGNYELIEPFYSGDADRQL